MPRNAPKNWLFFIDERIGTINVTIFWGCRRPPPLLPRFAWLVLLRNHLRRRPRFQSLRMRNWRLGHVAKVFAQIKTSSTVSIDGRSPFEIRWLRAQVYQLPGVLECGGESSISCFKSGCIHWVVAPVWWKGTATWIYHTWTEWFYCRDNGVERGTTLF